MSSNRIVASSYEHLVLFYRVIESLGVLARKFEINFSQKPMAAGILHVIK